MKTKKKNHTQPKINQKVKYELVRMNVMRLVCQIRFEVYHFEKLNKNAFTVEMNRDIDFACSPNL